MAYQKGSGKTGLTREQIHQRHLNAYGHSSGGGLHTGGAPHRVDIPLLQRMERHVRDQSDTFYGSVKMEAQWNAANEPVKAEGSDPYSYAAMKRRAAILDIDDESREKRYHGRTLDESNASWEKYRYGE